MKVVKLIALAIAGCVSFTTGATPSLAQQQRPALAAPQPNPASSGAASTAADKEMALSPRWMPDKHMVTEKMLKAMEFYARAALGGAQPGKEQVPAKVLFGDGWDLDWLMPLSEAEKKLPPGTRPQMGGANKLKNPCWPQDSIFVKNYQGKFMVPRLDPRDPTPPEVFTDLHLICDLKQRLIGAQFNTDQRRWLYWEKFVAGVPVKVEKLNPYFDFLTMGANAVAGRIVEYQVLRNMPGMVGMTCIHTVLPPGGAGSPLGNVRWYLAEPLAAKLVEIAEKNR